MQLCSFVSIFPRDSLTHRQAAWASTGAALLLIHPLSIAFYTKSKKIWIILEEITVLPWSDVLIRCFNQISCQISFVIVSYIKVGRVPRQKPLLTKNNTTASLIFGKTNLYIKTFGEIFCGLMRQKLNFLEGACPVSSVIKPTQHFIKITSYQQSNMVVVVWLSGAALQL